MSINIYQSNLKEIIKIMQKILIVLLILGAVTIGSNKSQAQGFKIGIALTYGSEAESIGLEGGIKFNVPIIRKLKATIDSKTFFLNSPGGQDYTLWESNANFNYPFLSLPSTSVYGLTGINYTGISTSKNNVQEISEPGLNIGVGAEYQLGFALAFSELKYIAGNFDQLDFSAGIRFGF